MKNLITTIPKSRFKSWAECEAELAASDGEDGSFWTVATGRLPKASEKGYPIGALCYMVFDGMVRGYLDIVNVDLTKNWPYHEGSKVPFCLVLANWHPIRASPYPGFQGWRYTVIQPQ